MRQELQLGYELIIFLKLFSFVPTCCTQNSNCPPTYMRRSYAGTSPSWIGKARNARSWQGGGEGGTYHGGEGFSYPDKGVQGLDTPLCYIDISF